MWLNSWFSNGDNLYIYTPYYNKKYRALTCLVHIEIQYGPTRIHTIFVLIRQQSRTGFGIRAARNQSKASAAHSSMRSLLKHAMPSRLSMSCCTNCASVGRCPSGTPTSLRGAALELVARFEVAVRVARLDQVEQRDTRHGSRSASRSVLFMTTNSVAVMPNKLRRCPNAVVASRHSRCLRTREHELVSS